MLFTLQITKATSLWNNTSHSPWYCCWKLVTSPTAVFKSIPIIPSWLQILRSLYNGCTHQKLYSYFKGIFFHFADELLARKDPAPAILYWDLIQRVTLEQEFSSASGRTLYSTGTCDVHLTIWLSVMITTGISQRPDHQNLEYKTTLNQTRTKRTSKYLEFHLSAIYPVTLGHLTSSVCQFPSLRVKPHSD